MATVVYMPTRMCRSLIITLLELKEVSWKAGTLGYEKRILLDLSDTFF
jgi:hypothetical protein